MCQAVTLQHDHVEEGNLRVPVDANPGPALLAEITQKEEMHGCLLYTAPAHDTAVVILFNFVLLPS
jgi:hypothetical protein